MEGPCMSNGPTTVSELSKNTSDTPAQLGSPPAQHMAPAATAAPPTRPPRRVPRLRTIAIAVAVVVAVAAAWWYIDSRNTVSTDDAYVNGHVTFVAPRVSGQ